MLAIRRLAFAALVCAASGLPAASADLVRVPSVHPVAETADRLAAAIEGAGATLFARIDHAAGAASVGETVPANVVLIFGNPAIGTPVIAAAPTAGLDLPLRVLVTEGGATDGDRGAVLVYRDPAAIAAAHGLAPAHPAIAKMAGALARLTASAAAE